MSTKKSRYKADDFIRAIDGSRGVVAEIARRMGCARNTVYNAVEKYATVAEALHDERESMKDYAENKLFKAIEKGSLTALIFYLKTQAKDRGYVERQEVGGQDNRPIPITIVNMDLDEL